MKILFDNEIFNAQKFGGISRYFANIIQGLKILKIGTYPVKFYSQNVHLNAFNLVKYKFLANIKYFRGKPRIDAFILKQESKGIAFFFQKEFDLYHQTYYNIDFLKYNIQNKPYVITIHDMIYELYFDKKYNIEHIESKNKRNLLSTATHIIAVSQSTKNDIIKCYPMLSAEKITVIYHGPTFKKTSATEKTTYRYLLFVGNRDEYKNFYWLIEVLNDYIKKTGLKIICAGGNSFSINEHSIIQKYEMENYISHQPIINDQHLINLYSNAVCFIFPSSFEGFGIPILEAFQCECPVILNKIPSFEEIAKGGALYFSMNHPDSLINNIELVTHNILIREDIIRRGSKRLSYFSWDKAVHEHLAVYNKVLTLSN